MIIIGRHVNGIILNELEYLLSDDNKPMLFVDEATASSFLYEHGLNDEDIESLVFLYIEEE